MNEVLARWNGLDPQEAEKEILSCCGSNAWVRGMTSSRPFDDEASLLIASDEVWRNLAPHDWLEAFKSHPRIGESRASVSSGARSENWSEQEQKGVSAGGDDLKHKLVEGNRAFEEKFGYIFIVCATGKSAAEILEILQRRLQNGKDAELREAAEEQRQIIQLRLQKWLGV
jgi:2-oxo-4-hydroxy-4-carboxy-5-ureidoimidazoline decarboxylase